VTVFVVVAVLMLTESLFVVMDIIEVFSGILCFIEKF
jgi:hypothetical protein